MLYCHNCLRECRSLVCNWCNSDFVEEIEDVQHDPSAFQTEDGPGLEPLLAQGLLQIIGQHFARMHDGQATAENTGPRTRSRARQEQNDQLPRIPGAYTYDHAVDGASNEPPEGLDLRSQMMMQMLQQFASLINESDVATFIPETVNIGDYAMGQRGLDDIITRLMELHDRENLPPAASQDTLNRLPRLAFKNSEHEHKECPVCQDDYAEGVETIVLPCHHMFHPDCILSWLKVNGTCPVCRLSLVTPSEQPPRAPNQDEPGESEIASIQPDID
ncbi:hypothetical protein HDV03_005196 [Kappamyces sp. JEL0829]|nr:hypothetical protein HDV03_005196 [Kappamyces sp. JEL0829]